MRKVVFVGATAGIGRALARRMAERGDRLVLLGRDPERLAASAADLALRGARHEVPIVRCDLRDVATIGPALARADELLDDCDVAITTAGVFGLQDELTADVARRDAVLETNFTGTLQFCEEARKRLLARGGGTLCALSSVAGERGRKKAALYGATKAGLSHYLEGIDHAHRDAGLRVVCIKPGFIHTRMTAHLEPTPFATDAETIAPMILDAIDRGTPVAFVPPVWRWVMAVIKGLPRSVMRRFEV